MLNIGWVLPGGMLTTGYFKLAFWHLLPFKNTCPPLQFLPGNRYLAKVTTLLILPGKGSPVNTAGMCKLYVWNISFIRIHWLIVDFKHYIHCNNGWHLFLKFSCYTSAKQITIFNLHRICFTLIFLLQVLLESC